jgi:hypothetical protein
MYYPHKFTLKTIFGNVVVDYTLVHGWKNFFLECCGDGTDKSDRY